MAHRATSPSKKQRNAPTIASATMSEPVATEAPRRGRKAKSTPPEQAEPSLTDIFFPGGNEPTDTGAKVGSGPPVRAQRGRKPKAQPDEQASALMAADSHIQAESPNPELTPNTDGEPSDTLADSGASPSSRKKRRRRTIQSERQPEASTVAAAASQPMQQAAARWDADSGTATFDWASIEQVAAADGPNQAMAKLLLAARAEGANSRWPF